MDESGHRKVLVVDDEYNIRDVLKMFLSDLGYTVSTAADLTESVSKINTDPPDIVFLDIVLPESNGLEILKLIKQFKKETIVIMMSGYRDEDDAKASLKLGAFDYITKPFDMSYITNMLNLINATVV